MTFTIDIEDTSGITAARNVYNETAETPFETDEEYVQFVMESAAESYRNQYPSLSV